MQLSQNQIYEEDVKAELNARALSNGSFVLFLHYFILPSDWCKSGNINLCICDVDFFLSCCGLNRKQTLLTLAKQSQPSDGLSVKLKNIFINTRR